MGFDAIRGSEAAKIEPPPKQDYKRVYLTCYAILARQQLGLETVLS